jgi:tetratricopeptide (TPR) repeat protein
VAALLAAALAVATLAVHRAQLELVQRRASVKELFDHGTTSAENDDFAKAIVQFEAAERLAEDYRGLEDLHRQAHEQAVLAGLKGTNRDYADLLFRAAKPLRFRLIGFCGDLTTASAELQQVLKPFFVLKHANWTTRNELTLLDDARRDRLVREVNELLFLWIVALDHACDQAPPPLADLMMKDARDGCDKALVFARPTGPWQALRARLAAWPRRVPGRGDSPAEVAAETSPLACFQWGLLRHREGRRDAALAWFRQAVRLEPSSYWYQYYLAYTLDESPRDADEALRHYDTAVALDKHAPWVRFCRARLYNNRSAWDLALEDLHSALVDFKDLPPAERDDDFERRVRLEFGVIHRALGNVAAARADYAAVIESDPTSRYALAARANRARLDVEAGDFDRARAEYDAVLEVQPDEGTARLGRALLALQRGRAAEAEADLTAALDGRPDPDKLPDLLANRAIARFRVGRAAEAEADAAAAWRLSQSPGAARLLARTQLELGRVVELRFDDPDEVLQFPLSGPGLKASLRAAAERLKGEAGRPTPAGLQALLTRAVILAALRDPDAEAEAGRAVALAPLSSQVYLVRARVRFHLGRLEAAGDDVEHGLSLQPDEPRLWELGGRLKTAAGDPRGALADLDRALQLGAEATALGPRAIALLALGDAEQAAYDWTLALKHDPENPRAFLGRARAFLRLGRWDLARADLEQAAAWTEDWSGLGPPIVQEYARCLPARPGQLPRVLALARRTLAAMSAAQPDHRPAGDAPERE